MTIHVIVPRGDNIQNVLDRLFFSNQNSSFWSNLKINNDNLAISEQPHYEIEK